MHSLRESQLTIADVLIRSLADIEHTLRAGVDTQEASTEQQHSHIMDLLRLTY